MHSFLSLGPPTHRASRPAMFVSLIFALLAVSGFAPRAAHAQFLVTSAADDGSAGTLRYEVNAANTAGGGTITFAPALAGQTITETPGTITLTAPITITAPAGGVSVSGSNVNTVLTINGGTSPITLSGLTIENGSTNGGGGISVNSGYAALTNCTLTGNSGFYDGGGLYNDGTVSLTGCTFTNNSTGNGRGGGLFNDGLATLTDCTFTGNSASQGGGGLFNDGTVSLTGCTFNGNNTNNNPQGGGGLLNSGTVSLTGCTFTGNTANGGQGGGLCNNTRVSLTGCTFTGNTASGGQGGGLCNNATATLMGCALNNNSAFNGGGLCSNDTVSLTGCTFTANSANSEGGGLFNDGNTATLTDDILYGDTASNGSEVSVDYAPVTATYCDIGQTGYGQTSNPTAPDSSNNFNADPLFNSENAAYTGSDPFGLQSTSPCLGKGISVPGVMHDIAGNPRFAAPSLGAYEYVAQTLVVSNTASGTRTAGSLGAAVASANSTPYTVITFDPTVFATPQTITPGVTLTISEPTAIVGPSAGVAVDGGGSVQVFNVSSTGSLSAIGLTIQHGSTDINGDGGGLYNKGDTLTLTDCTFTANSANNGDGGGLYNDGGTVSLTNCTFTANNANGKFGGGGLYNFAGTAMLTGCTFTANTADNGGGLFNASGTTMLTDDILYGDTASDDIEVSVNHGTVAATYCDIGGGYTTGTPSTPDDSNNFNADPLFVSGAAPFDLHVQPGSPVVGMGLYGASAPTDITGATRANPPTLGAYEGTVADSATTLAVATGSSQTITVGQSAAFTATVTNTSAGSTATPAGTVQFSVNGTPFGSAVAVSGSNGTATATSAPDTFTSAGSPTITATYTPTNAFVGSRTTGSGLTETVLATLGVAVNSSANPSASGQPITFTVHVTAGGGVSVTGLTVNLLNASSVLLISGATDSTGTAAFTLPSNSLPVGANQLTFHVIAPPGYADSSVPYTQNVTDTPPTIGAAPNVTADATSAAGAVVTFPAPTATDVADGTDPVVCSPPSGSVFPLGTTTVTGTATDKAGLMSKTTFTVTVLAPEQIVESVNTNLSGLTLTNPLDQLALWLTTFALSDAGSGQDWTDPSHPKTGDAFTDGSAGATGLEVLDALAGFLQPSLTGAQSATLTSSLSRLRDAYRVAALIAIAQSASNNAHLKAANSALSRGDSQSCVDQAILDYETAWQDARSK